MAARMPATISPSVQSMKLPVPARTAGVDGDALIGAGAGRLSSTMAVDGLDVVEVPSGVVAVAVAVLSSGIPVRSAAVTV